MARKLKNSSVNNIGNSSNDQTSPKRARMYDLYPPSAGLLPTGTPSDGRVTSPRFKRRGTPRSPLKSNQAKISRIPVYRNKKGSSVSSRTKELHQSTATKSLFNITRKTSKVSPKVPTVSNGRVDGALEEKCDLSGANESQVAKTDTSTLRQGPSQNTKRKRSGLPLGMDNWRNGSSFKRSTIKGKGIGKGGAKRVARLRNKQSVSSFARKSTAVKDKKSSSSIAAGVSPPLPAHSKSLATRSSRRRSTVMLLANGSSEFQSWAFAQDEDESSAPDLEELEPMTSESSAEEEEEEEENESENEDSSEDNRLNANERKDGVFGLSRSLLRNLFCLYSKRRLTRGAMDLVLQFTDTYLRQLMEDMDSCAGKAGRRTVTMDDVTMLLRQQHSITNHQEWITLVHSQLPMDYAQILMPCSLIKKH